jgi:RND family efflux transporter MFP subunit
VSAQPPLELATTRVLEEPLVEPILGTGTVIADKTTNVGPRVDGIIAEVFVQVGDRVKEGDPLFRTRQVDYDLRLQSARSSLMLARAEAKQVKRDLERVRALRKKAVVSVEQLEAAETRRQIAVARVQTSQAALERAEQDFEDTVVKAPYDGVITRRLIDEGAMMRTMMSSGSFVVQLMKTDVVLAVVHVPEVQLPYIGIGTPGRVHVDGLDREFETEVTIVNDLVDPATHTIEVRLPIANPELAVKPGLFVKAELEPKPRPALLLDRSAVLGFGEERYVFVELDGRAARRHVRVRDLDAARVEILAGLEGDERVLIGPELARLTEGTPIGRTTAAEEPAGVDL